MRYLTTILLTLTLIAGCGVAERLPAISSLSLGLPVISEVGENFGDIVTFKWTTPDDEMEEYRPTEPHFLIFWRYGCESCLAELEHIQDFIDENDIPIVVVSLNDLNSITMVVTLLEDMDINFEIISDPTQVLRLPYQISSVPDTMLVSATGKIIARKKASINEQTLPNLRKELK